MGVKMILFMVPVPVQVCGPNGIADYPRGYNLTDTILFDIDKPQRLTQEITSALGIDTYDLRPPLQAMKECPYQPYNLHWTANGHISVAEYITNTLIENKYIP